MSRDVVHVHPDTPIARVLELLIENDITGVPVVESNGDLVGIVTEKDMIGILFGQDTPSGTARDCMTEDVLSFDENDDIIAVCECLITNHLRRVPILADGRLVGIISRRDLIKYIIEPIGR
ncbi:MAG: CBS domain-containing protein [Planctomycetota bacterium]|nr:CBS domain-containing protein [Planctomycetota bacterium]